MSARWLRTCGLSEATGAPRSPRASPMPGNWSLCYGGATLPSAAYVSIASRALRNMLKPSAIIGMAAVRTGARPRHDVCGRGHHVFEMRHMLKRRQGLSVIVNSWRWRWSLRTRPASNVIQIVGHYRPDARTAWGRLLRSRWTSFADTSDSSRPTGSARISALVQRFSMTAYLYQHVIRERKGHRASR